MGSPLRLTAWTRDEGAARSAFGEVFAEFARLEKLMSTWIPESDAERINRATGKQPVKVSGDVREVLNTARQISEWTDGKFDVSFGALSGLWKFDHDQDNVIPDADEVRQRLPLIDYRAIQIDDKAGTAFLARKGMSIHLGGIGKGYAIDRGVDTLRRRGVRDFMIQSGGDIYVSGLKDGRPWRLAIQDPRGAPNRTFAELDLSRWHVQHVRRLRALFHQGRPPLSPHHRSFNRRAGARLTQRDDCRQSRDDRGRAFNRCVHPRSEGRNGADRTASGC